jgi:hypothetical protein
MDDIRRYQSSFSREVYNLTRRETGCPPVIAIRLKPSHWGRYVEMKDGSFSIDSVDASDVWEAKCKCIAGWLEKKNLIDHTASQTA